MRDCACACVCVCACVRACVCARAREWWLREVSIKKKDLLMCKTLSKDVEKKTNLWHTSVSAEKAFCVTFFIAVHLCVTSVCFQNHMSAKTNLYTVEQIGFWWKGYLKMRLRDSVCWVKGKKGNVKIQIISVAFNSAILKNKCCFSFHYLYAFLKIWWPLAVNLRRGILLY
jgi:hypothetical protein